MLPDGNLSRAGTRLPKSTNDLGIVEIEMNLSPIIRRRCSCSSNLLIISDDTSSERIGCSIFSLMLKERRTLRAD